MSAADLMPGVLPLGLLARSIPPLHRASATFHFVRLHVCPKAKERRQSAGGDARQRSGKRGPAHLVGSPVRVRLDAVAAPVAEEGLG